MKNRSHTRTPKAERLHLSTRALRLLQADERRTVRSVARKLNVNYQTLCTWLKVYHGYQRGKRTHYSAEQKKTYVARARRMIDQGQSVQQAARRLGLWKSTLWSWMKDETGEEIDEWHVLPSWMRMQKFIEATGTKVTNTSTPLYEHRIPHERASYLR
jgi:transposase-like protein